MPAVLMPNETNLTETLDRDLSRSEPNAHDENSAGDGLRPEPRVIPGTDVPLDCERNEAGAISRLCAAGREYFRIDGSDRIYGEGLAVVSEITLPNGFLRRITARLLAGDETWVEEYFWDGEG